ncbi:D-alanyl-D-alanine carboxypeptidase [Succinivibrio dextrinosolvens]|uniref:M15 family metallopeptidase n=1 Tax=Succinivibrio dextrinosolvens TaxID=83771 RepID=UPI0008E4BB74|nr:M15 family metallopeptidase [Succinivibrio dextrinosolvens]SFS42911.1 D-alanyl-D-alanine carboxypeptidase [Succinivibrio dextrinosolvens]
MSCFSLKKNCCCLLLSCALSSMVFAEEPKVVDINSINGGDVIETELLNSYGENSFFTLSEIPDAVWEKMQGKTYQENPFIKREDLRYLRLLHVDYDRKVRLGEMVCNRAIAEDLREIFFILYKNKYPIAHIRLADEYNADDEIQMRENNTSCFVFRFITGSDYLSYHARGLAVDLNPRTNPYCKLQKDGTLFVQPMNSGVFCERDDNFVYKIDKQDLAYKLFISHGFTWGGEWRTLKDYCHFEKETMQLSSY